MYITVLCRVVDNFGDIGVAWRLCRRLAKIQSQYKICLVVDDMNAFNIIAHGTPVIASTASPVIASEASPVIASEARQSTTIENIEIFQWNDNDFCHQVFSENDGERLQIILELFQCGRPDWMEKILFEEKLERTVQIIMIDYLTAEKYAEDFHCLQSLTRSARVRKVNFMPGFTEKTGGLIIDDEWEELPPYNKDGPVLEFTYKTKYAYLDNKKLPYMPQTEWDKMMKQCRVLFVRGEESMSRACLSGIPFIWQAYPQSEEYQLVKVRALLERMRPHFKPEDFEVVEKAWMAINTDQHISGLPRRCAPRNDAIFSEASSLRAEAPSLRAEGEAIHSSVYTIFLNTLPRLRPGFVSFAQSLRKNGDLCSNLMTFIEKLAII